MTHSIHCVASYPGVPSVAPCRDGHLESCGTPEDHPGCRARLADRGFLCDAHFHRLEVAYSAWPEFEARYQALDGATAVRRRVPWDSTGRTTADGHANLTPGFMAVEEARRHLATAAGHESLELWCGTQEGSAEAIQFAAAAERAYRAVEVEERPHRLRSTPCPRFGCEGVLIWSPPAWFEKPVQITCRDCGTTVSQDAFDYGEYA